MVINMNAHTLIQDIQNQIKEIASRTHPDPMSRGSDYLERFYLECKLFGKNNKEILKIIKNIQNEQGGIPYQPIFTFNKCYFDPSLLISEYRNYISYISIFRVYPEKVSNSNKSKELLVAEKIVSVFKQLKIAKIGTIQLEEIEVSIKRFKNKCYHARIWIDQWFYNEESVNLIRNLIENFSQKNKKQVKIHFNSNLEHYWLLSMEKYCDVPIQCDNSINHSSNHTMNHSSNNQSYIFHFKNDN